MVKAYRHRELAEGKNRATHQLALKFKLYSVIDFHDPLRFAVGHKETVP